MKNFRKNPGLEKNLGESAGSTAVASTPSARIGKLILHYRGKRGLTQGQLAEKSIVDQSAISRIESGRHDAKPATLIKLYRTLEIPEVEIKRLTANDFEVGSIELKLKLAILRAILRRELPGSDASEDIRQRLDRYDSSEFRQLTFSLKQRDQVLGVLIDEGYLVGILQGVIVPREHQNQIDMEVVRKYEDQVHLLAALAERRAGEQLPLVVSEIDRVFNTSSSLVSVEELFDAIEYAHLLLTRGDVWELRMTPVYIGMIRHVYQVSLSLLRLKEVEEFFKAFAGAIGKLFREALSRHRPGGKMLQTENDLVGRHGTPLQDTLRRYFEGHEQLVMHSPLA